MTPKKTKNFEPAVMGEGDEDFEVHDISTMEGFPNPSSIREKIATQVLGAFQPNEEFDRARSEANAELIQLVAQFLTDNPTQRFGQALNNLGLLDNASNAEPMDQLKRAKKILRRMSR